MSKKQGITVKKSENFSEWYSQVVEKADLADIRYNVQGFIVHKTWSIKILREIIRMFESGLEKTGHEPVMFPLVIPEENLKKEKEHFNFLPEVFWVTEKGAHEKMEKRLALRPTSETAFYPMYSLWIRSHRHLPMKKYQTVNVYRNEPVTRPFIRGREFIFMEAHDAFATHEEVLSQVEADIENMREVLWEKLGIPISFFKRPEWDKFLGADDTFATDVLMPDGKVLQVGSTHDLGQKFSRPFDIKFVDQNGEEQYVWQTSYGPGIWRIFASLIAIHGDDRGLILPFEIAPVQIVIVPIFYNEKDRKKILRKCEKMEKLLSKNYKVHLDNENKTPGEKYNKWEVFGVPLRIEVGSKEASSKFVTISRRDTGEKFKVDDKMVEKKVHNLSEKILENMRSKAKSILDSSVSKPKNKHDFIRDAMKGGIVRAAFCGTENCAREIQNETKGVKVRGTLIGKKEKVLGKCIYCSKSASQIVYMAKQY